MVKKVQNIVLWLENWFSQTKDVVLRNQGQANKNLVTDASGNVTLENKPVIDTVLADSTNAVQNSAINNAITTINGRLDDLESFKAIQIVESLPTASADTMNRLYVVSENGKVNVYYTKKSGSTYSWEKLDDNILDELSISWSDITGKPFTTVDSALSSSSTNPLQNKAINAALNNKANANHTHTITNISDATDNILVPNGADYTIFKNTTGRNVPLDVVLQSFGVYSANLYNNKEDKGECITSIELVPKSSDNTGAIKLYYGDEPS